MGAPQAQTLAQPTGEEGSAQGLKLAAALDGPWESPPDPIRESQFSLCANPKTLSYLHRKFFLF